MKVYIVRHGVTEDAEAGRRQFPESPLSEIGIKQARAAGKRLLREKVDKVYASKIERAKETAEIIAAEINLPIEFFEGIHEKETAKILHGITDKDPLHKEQMEELKTYYGDLDWKFRNEGESLREVTERAAKFRDYLTQNHPNDDILVVSHSGFIRGFIASCILGNEYSDPDMFKLWMSFYVTNTGISLLEYDPNKGLWILKYFNDHLHLDF